MSPIGTESNPLRVAIIGAGPTGFYAAGHLLDQKKVVVEVDMFERLSTPFGLVRYGVAPDHQKIKSVTKVFDKIASNPRFRFFGNVELGKHLSVADLRQFYHQIIYTTGAQTDKRMGIPGEDLQGSHPATEFVAWYNGHPDFRDYQFDLSQERVAVVGVGNVAVDVARILCRTPEELAKTDIADYALEALRHSRVKEVYILGRRGPAQAAFTNPEVKELGEMADTDAFTRADEVKLDPLSEAAMAANADRATARKVEILQSYADRQPTGKSRRLTLRFLVSPVELIGDEQGQVVAMKIVKNKLVASDAGSLRPQATDEYETLPVGLVFRSIGYNGVPLPGVPFHHKWGVILNREGRVIDETTQEPVVGEYTAGWIKRGPSGVIGTNKPDALETVECMLADLEKGVILSPEQPERDAAAAFVAIQQPGYFSYADWLKADEMEIANGQAVGRPRVKFIHAEEIAAAIGKKI
jgi:ferredoxin--NADP+ reductase